AAVAPHILSQPTTIPWSSLSLTLLGVLVAGLLAGLLAVITTTRLPLLPAILLETSRWKLETRLMSSDWQLRRDLSRIGKLVYQRGLVAGTDGNISARVSGDRLLI